MTDQFALVLAGLAGLLLGVIFFGGLWWTVKKGMTSARPAAWFFLSLLLRLSFVLLGFYCVGQGDWHRLVACLVGFIIARVLVSRFSAYTENEVRHEPQS